MKLKMLRYSLIGIILLAACNPALHVYSDFDKNADIAKYKTYTWLTEKEFERKGINPLYYNELNDKRIKQAVYKQMKKKGFIYTDDKQIIEMHYHIIVEDKTISLPEPFGHLYGPSWQIERRQIYPYRLGTLIIDLMDTSSKTLVWRGWATGAIENAVSKKPEQAIERAVEKIFSLFPFQR